MVRLWAPPWKRMEHSCLYRYVLEALLAPKLVRERLLVMLLYSLLGFFFYVIDAMQ